ncbi:MAG: heparinase II/III-family protein [Clostridia bacterium]|nr:heparinase II/III-family protein [Clostridia bacterium]
MLFDKFNLRNILLPREKFFPFRTDKAFWGSLPQDIATEAISEGEKFLGYDWQRLDAVRYMDFSRDGNRTAYEDINFARRKALNCLTIAECIEDKGRFLDDIVNGLWCICEESTWVLPAHNGGEPLPDVSKPNIDLFSAQTAAQLAFCIYLLKERLDKVSTVICRRIEKEITVRVIDPFMEHNFWWMGFGCDRRKIPSNWTSWCVSTCTAACLLTERDHAKRADFIGKALQILDYYIEAYPDDGGCDEGAEYWHMSAGCMFDALELLYAATDGKLSIFDLPKIDAMGSYIYKVYAGGEYFVNFADCSAAADRGGARTYLFGKRINNQTLMAFGADDYIKKASKTMPYTMNMFHKLISLSCAKEIYEQNISYECDNESTYIGSLELLCARNKNFMLAAKGGSNGDNHNHNDVGSFMVYMNRAPLIIDVGVGSYTKKTFGKDRYTIWTMQSAYHNLPTVNGKMQEAGDSFCATEVIYEKNRLSCEIKGAYPRNSDIVSWVRKFELFDDFVSVGDSFILEKSSNDVVISVMTKDKPSIGKYFILLGDAVIEYPFEKWSVVFEEIRIPEDAKLTPVWGRGVYRLLFKLKKEAISENFELKIKRRLYE